MSKEQFQKVFRLVGSNVFSGMLRNGPGPKHVIVPQQAIGDNGLFRDARLTTVILIDDCK